MSFWNKIFKSEEKVSEQNDIEPVKVVVVDFDDGSQEKSGRFLESLLAEKSFLEVSFYDEGFDKTFLNLQGKNFFDFYDTGKQILKKTKADVLIWGWKKDEKLRLNLQVLKQYEKKSLLSVSLLDGLYLPFDYFKEGTLPEVMVDLICAMILAATDSRADVLSELVDKIAKKGSPAGLSVEYMPYVLNTISLV